MKYPHTWKVHTQKKSLRSHPAPECQVFAIVNFPSLHHEFCLIFPVYIDTRCVSPFRFSSCPPVFSNAVINPHHHHLNVLHLCLIVFPPLENIVWFTLLLSQFVSFQSSFFL